MGLFSRKKQIIGLEIGDNSVKMAEIKMTHSGYELVNFAAIEIAERDQVSDAANSLLLMPAVQKLKEIYGRNLPKVAVSVSGNNVLLRHMLLPVMPDEELAEAIKFEIEATFPIPMAEMIVDYVKVGQKEEDGAQKVELMIVAARKEVVENTVVTLEGVGIEPVKIDIEPLALLRVVELGFQIHYDDTYLIVNVGPNNTNISIFSQDSLRFTRGVNFGSKRIEIVSENDEQNAYDDILLEVNRTIDFYQAKYRERRITQVYLAGDCKDIDELARLGAEQLGVSTEVLSPFDYMNISPKMKQKIESFPDRGSSMAVAIGMALSEVE